MKREAIQDSEVLFFGSEFSGHPCSVAREQRHLRMLCFVLGSFGKNQRCRLFTLERVTVSRKRGGGYSLIWAI